MRRVALGLVLVGACAMLASVACDRDKPRPRATAQSDNDEPQHASTPAQFYAARCEACHGKRGRGDGPTASTLTPRPRSFAEPTWQSATTDADIRKVIVGGGPAVSKSPLMPANPDLSKDEATVSALVAIVRSFATATPSDDAPDATPRR